MACQSQPDFVVSFFADGSFEVRVPDSKEDEHAQKRDRTELSKRLLEALSCEGGNNVDTKPPCTTPDTPKHRNYLQRMMGKGKPPPPAKPGFIAWSVIGAFLGQFALLLLHYPVFGDTDLVWIVASFGAQATLLFAAPSSPLAQPWNAIFGSAISSVIGVLAWKFVGAEETLDLPYLSGALAVSLSIGAMLVTRSVHPPAGAQALIATLGGTKVKELGFLYVLFPSVISSTVHVLIALLVNNISSDPSRQYPVFWRPIEWPQPMGVTPPAQENDSIKSAVECKSDQLQLV